MNVILRDDDTCFYTKPSDLEAAFGGLPAVPVSLSVVPFAAYEHRGTYPFRPEEPREGYADIADNQPLVSYLNEQFASGRYCLMLHGIHHEYHPRGDGEWDTEMRVLPYSRILEGILDGKRHLEQLFGREISTFIGASNDISADCEAALDEIGLHTNYMIYKKFNRRFNLHNVLNYLRANIYRAFTHKRYAGVLRCRRHCEVLSFPFENLEQMKECYRKCKESGHPLVVYTHYWSLNANPGEKAELAAFVNWAMADGADFITMNELWKADKRSMRK